MPADSSRQDRLAIAFCIGFALFASLLSVVVIRLETGEKNAPPSVVIQASPVRSQRLPETLDVPDILQKKVPGLQAEMDSLRTEEPSLHARLLEMLAEFRADFDSFSRIRGPLWTDLRADVFLTGYAVERQSARLKSPPAEEELETFRSCLREFFLKEIELERECQRLEFERLQSQEKELDRRRSLVEERIKEEIETLFGVSIPSSGSK